MLRRIPFYFLRHGQTEWNARHLCQGQTDTSLNDTGIRQAEEARRRLQAAQIPIATVCCSPLSRARRTAEIINEALRCPLVVIDGLQEIFFGAAQGKPLPTLAYAALLRSAEAAGGETFDHFTTRVLRGIDAALAEPGPVLVVAHGGCFHAFQSHMRLPNDQRITNASPMLVSPCEDPAGPAWTVAPV